MSQQPYVTRLETDDEIRQALEARRARAAAKTAPPPTGLLQAPAAKVPLVAEPASAELDTQPFRPLLRPPTAVLCVCDDGKTEGEQIRLRGERFVIGRAEGDLLIAHDGLMSGRHAEIVREKTDAGFRWFLVDLKSRNGLFVRVGNTMLRHGSEVLVGRSHFRFETPAGEAANLGAHTPAQGTIGWGSSPVQSLMPILMEMTPAGPGERFPLPHAEYWIGRDVHACAVARPDDPFLSPRHARLYRDAKGWHIENAKSLNGVWFRMDRVPVDNACQFQLGEQRFVLRVLS